MSRNFLRKPLKERGFRLIDIARMLGKSKQYMTELGQGNIRLTYSMAFDIAEAVGCKPDDLFYEAWKERKEATE